MSIFKTLKEKIGLSGGIGLAVIIGTHSVLVLGGTLVPGTQTTVHAFLNLGASVLIAWKLLK